ncbi:MAG: phage holin family protein [Geminicoccaceae bacterium]|nr:phage holin family protein [Geminicoccaceae bacterium]
MRTLAALLGLPAISFARLGTGVALLIVALVLVIIGLIRLIDTVQIALMLAVGPVLASLLTALVVLLFAMALVASARVYLRPRARVQNAAAAGAGAEMVAQVMGMIRNNPRTAAAGAALLGVLIGSTPELRRSLNDVINPKPKRRVPPNEEAPR